MINASSNFLRALQNPIKELWIKLEFYDKDMAYISNFEHQVLENDIGSISVDITRPIRRSFSFSLNNIDNQFDWGDSKLIWINKRIKLFIGLKYNGVVEYIPQGVYILTEPTQTHLDKKTTTINAVDKAFLYTDKRGKFSTQTTVLTGVNVTDAIRIIANQETLFNFDNDITTTVPYDITFEPQSNRWEALLMLANFAKCLIYYDVNGYLRLKKIDLNDIQNNPYVWSFNYGGVNEKFYAGSVRKFSDELLCNHVIALGGSGQIATSSYELIVDENNPLWADSPYTIQQLGDILYMHNNGNMDSVLLNADDCKFRCKFELMNRLGYTERVQINIAPHYLLEGGDIILFEDLENGISESRFLITSMSIPIKPDIMVLECKKENLIIDDWDFI